MENQHSGMKSESERIDSDRFLELFKESPIPDNEKIQHLGLFIKRQPMSRIIFMWELYKNIINVHGSIFEFGVRWGQDLALFESFRGILEPFNHNRRIIGFDTFSGFPSITENDKLAKVGDMGVTENYDSFLEDVLHNHENASPISHIKKFELVKGDAILTCKRYLEDHPETIIAFAYFDFDIYEPTKECLKLCKDHFIKGSIIAFDELNNPNWPGETIALKEVMGLNNIKIQRLPFMPTASYVIYE